jgi:hypothetical protein
VAARLRRELGIEVDSIRGHYGEYRVLVDDEVVVDGGPLVILGLMPSARKIVDAVRQRVSSNAPELDTRGAR